MEWAMALNASGKELAKKLGILSWNEELTEKQRSGLGIRLTGSLLLSALVSAGSRSDSPRDAEFGA
jgi:hypothetical protein